MKEELERQIYIMQTPQQWQRHPFLPLVRRHEGKDVECGFLYQDRASRPTLMPTVYLGIIFTIRQIQVVGKKGAILVDSLSKEEVKELTSLNYPTFASIVYDGWTVDE